ncbi:hypothetical protein DFH09DRAFT_1098645 [Mycena vulgaris]|nr:hypothetical protein DFH09DRAFT_1098645 [Mycena vulgaris]
MKLTISVILPLIAVAIATPAFDASARDCGLPCLCHPVPICTGKTPQSEECLALGYLCPKQTEPPVLGPGAIRNVTCETDCPVCNLRCPWAPQLKARGEERAMWSGDRKSIQEPLTPCETKQFCLNLNLVVLDLSVVVAEPKKAFRNELITIRHYQLNICLKGKSNILPRRISSMSGSGISARCDKFDFFEGVKMHNRLLPVYWITNAGSFQGGCTERIRAEILERRSKALGCVLEMPEAAAVAAGMLTDQPYATE